MVEEVVRTLEVVELYYEMEKHLIFIYYKP